jgi:hypothetical protein
VLGGSRFFRAVNLSGMKGAGIRACQTGEHVDGRGLARLGINGVFPKGKPDAFPRSPFLK